MCATRTTTYILVLEECSDPTSVESGDRGEGSQSVLKLLQSLAGCAVYGMVDGPSSNVSGGHNAKMYTAAPGPLLYMLYAIRMPPTMHTSIPYTSAPGVYSSCAFGLQQPRVERVRLLNNTNLLICLPRTGQQLIAAFLLSPHTLSCAECMHALESLHTYSHMYLYKGTATQSHLISS